MRALRIIAVLSLFFILGNVYGSCVNIDGRRICIIDTSVRFNMGKCRETKTFDDCEQEALRKALKKSRLLNTIVTVTYYNE